MAKISTMATFPLWGSLILSLTTQTEMGMEKTQVSGKVH